ncbi:MAG TPA: ATP-binding protein [Bryobacteraceae bacterium]|nr:ATP-binding protein [Bryobacteraceae bacterium]
MAASARPELRRRLGRELAVRARFGWPLHLIFLVLFASQSDFGTSQREAVWIYSGAVVAGGLFRVWSARRVLKLKDGRAERWLTALQCGVHFHSLCWGAFLSFAFYKVFGNHTMEATLLISIGGFTAMAAFMFAACPAVSVVCVAAQMIPDLIWAAFARGQMGILPLLFGLIFLTLLSGVVVIQHRHIVSMIEAQMLLEFQGETLRAAKEAAEQASTARARFLANMSHEVRTPINGILGSAQLLAEGPLDPQQQPVMEALLRSAEDLLALVDDILDFSKMRAGKMRLECEAFDLQKLVHEVVTPMLPVATAKGVTCRIEIAHDLPRGFRGDSLRIRQVLRNLLGNAIKFTPSGEISLTVKRGRPGWVSFILTDTGIGIAADKLPTLFQDFAQADSSTTRRFGGSGLGLAISKNLTDLMQGRLHAESELGKGSRFYFEIPLPSCEPPSGALHALDGVVRATDARLPTGLRVLVAEDNPINRLIAEKFLTASGAIVDQAATGKEAVALFSAHEYGVVLMDCHMPEMDGFEAAAAIRSLGRRGAAVPILAVSASVLEENRERCLEGGMNGLVSKPVRREALIEAILAALNPAALNSEGGTNPECGIQASSWLPPSCLAVAPPIRQT